MANVDLMQLVKNKVRSLQPYQVENIDCEIMLHANESAFPPPPEISKLFGEVLQGCALNRYPDPNCRELKSVLAKQHQVPPEQFMIGNGSDELIQILLQIFCDPGDGVAFPDPTFAMYAIIAQGMGLTPHSVPLDENWDFRAENFLEAIKNQPTRIIFFSYPNNPTGNCFSSAEIQKVIENFSGIVVVDEAYYDFSTKSFTNELARHNNLIILRSLSKIGLAALRVGYGIADPRIIEQVDKVRLPYNSNTLSQSFSAKLLNHFSPIQKQIDTIIEERKRLFETLQGFSALTVYPSDANFILFRVNPKADEVFKRLMENGILVRNLGNHPRLNNCLRVTVGTRKENDRFIEQLNAII